MKIIKVIRVNGINNRWKVQLAKSEVNDFKSSCWITPRSPMLLYLKICIQKPWGTYQVRNCFFIAYTWKRWILTILTYHCLKDKIITTFKILHNFRDYIPGDSLLGCKYSMRCTSFSIKTRFVSLLVNIFMKSEIQMLETVYHMI